MESSLNEINLGRIDAESDEQLEAYFVETGAVDGGPFREATDIG